MAYTSIITENTTFPAVKVKSIFKTFMAMRETSKQRRALSRLSHAELNDIGVTSAQRTAECNRRFWQQSK